MLKHKYFDYFILCARVLLAWTFLSYGWGKLTNDQFGISQVELSKPLKEVGLFKLSWYLFDQEPFKSFIGISQIITAILLLYNRTFLLGALIAIPILLNILIIDITYIKMAGFYWRLSYYLFLDFAILYHSKDKLIPIFYKLTKYTSSKFKFPIWAYLILPLMAIVLELLGVIPKILTGFAVHPSETWKSMCDTIVWISEMIKKVFSSYTHVICFLG